MNEPSQHDKVTIPDSVARSLIERVNIVGQRWANAIVGALREQASTIIERAHGKVGPHDSNERRLEVMRELGEELEELLDSVEIRVTVGERSFTVKGFAQ